MDIFTLVCILALGAAVGCIFIALQFEILERRISELEKKCGDSHE